MASLPRPGPVWSRIRHFAAGNLSYKPFLVLLALGVLGRVAVTAMYSPAWLQSLDELRFARVLPPGMFEDRWMPAGYPFFVRGLRALVPELWVPIAIQHLIGLGVGTVLFLTMRRLGAKAWLACVPAGFIFLSGDQIWTEHQLMAENFVTAFLVVGLGCAVRGLVPRLDLRWLAAGSAFLMCAGLSRNVALAGLPVLILCTLFWVRGGYPVALRALAAAVLPAALVFLVYLGVFEAGGGLYLGLTDMSGWNLYARVAPIADCTRFTPSAKTKVLCETTPLAERDGSLGYQWDPASRGRQVFEIGTENDATVGQFAREVIVHQPLSYLQRVATEAARYIDSSIESSHPFSGVAPRYQSFGLVDPGDRETIERELGTAYDDAHVHVIGRGVLAGYQEATRIPGAIVGLLVALTLAGMFLATGAARLGAFLFGGTALLLYLVPVLVLSYEFRYGLQAQPFIVVSATLGAAALLSRAPLKGPWAPIEHRPECS